MCTCIYSSNNISLNVRDLLACGGTIVIGMTLSWSSSSDRVIAEAFRRKLSSLCVIGMYFYFRCVHHVDIFLG